MKYSKNIIYTLLVIIVIIIIYFIFPKKNNIPLKNLTSTKVKTSLIGQNPILNLSKLTSLKNYTFSFTDNSLTMTGVVYSKNNWSLQKPFQEYHVNGYIYTKLANTWYRQNEALNNYAHSPYISSAEQFIGYKNVYGIKLQEGKSCTIAGVKGHLWIFKSPSNGGLLNEVASSCISNKGYMLSEYIGAQGSAINGKKYTSSFIIQSIGDTKAYIPPTSFKID